MVETARSIWVKIAKLYFVRPFPGLFSSFFSLIEIKEQASRQIANFFNVKKIPQKFVYRKASVSL